MGEDLLEYLHKKGIREDIVKVVKCTYILAE